MHSPKVFFIFFTVLLFGCKDPVPEPQSAEEVPMLNGYVNVNYGVDQLFIDSVYTLPNGDEVKFTDIKFYLEDLRNGSSVLTDAALFDLKERQNLLFSVEGKSDDFSSLTGNIGVQQSLNHDDPTSFPSNSWLNIVKANDMYWSWNPGFIFFKIEGMMDTIPDGNPLFDHGVSYHIGMDANLRSTVFNNINWTPISTYTSVCYFNLDIEKVFITGTTQIDMRSDHSIHSAVGEEVITGNLADNFLDALQ